MTFYAVRIAETHEAVGLLEAANLEQLWWLTDQVTDAGDCEYARISQGGIVWLGQTKNKLPLEEDYSMAEDFPEDGTGHLDSADFDEYLKIGHWKSLYLPIEKVIPELKNKSEIKKQEVADFLNVRNTYPKQ